MRDKCMIVAEMSANHNGKKQPLKPSGLQNVPEPMPSSCRPIGLIPLRFAVTSLIL